MKVQPKLLRDVTDIQLSLVEGKDGKDKVMVRGEFAKADAPTQNKRVYSEKIWTKQIGRLGKPMESRKVFGELDHPSDGKTSLSRVSHLVTDLRLEDGVLVGEAEILDTARGRDLKALLQANCRVGVSSRGYGSTKTDENGNEVVQDDYRLASFDFVADPADSDAYPEVFTEDVDNPLTAEEHEAQVEMARSDVQAQLESELRAEYSERLLSMVAGAKSEIREVVLEEVSKDPAVLGAKAALEQVKEVLRPFIVEADQDAVLKSAREEIERLKNLVEEKDLEIKTLQDERDAIADVAREVGYKWYLEQQLQDRDDAELIRKLIGDLKEYDSSEQLQNKLASVIEELDKARKESSSEDDDQALLKLKEENEELRKALEDLQEDVDSKDLTVYAESVLAGNPRAARIRRAIHVSNPKSEKDIDALVESFEEPERDAESQESIRSRVRRLTRGGHNRRPGTRLEEDAKTTVRREDKDFNGLGVPLSQLRNLSGVAGT